MSTRLGAVEGSAGREAIRPAGLDQRLPSARRMAQALGFA